MKIIVDHVHPPIPTRDFDWSAYADNYEPGCPLEHGRTAKAAVEALLDNHCAARGADPDRDGQCRVCLMGDGPCGAVLP